MTDGVRVDLRLRAFHNPLDATWYLTWLSVGPS